jgi:HEAT repeat protein
MTPIRVAYILGERRVKRAVSVLEKTIEENSDPYLVQASIVAIGKIGLAESVAFLNTCLQPGYGILARKAAYEAIEQIKQKNM